MDTYVVDFDDFCKGDHALPFLKRLHQRIPGFKVTLFVIPGLSTREWLASVIDPWMQLGLHGDLHSRGECTTWTRRDASEYLDRYERWGLFQKLFRPPYWNTPSRGMLNELEGRGYTLAVNKPTDYTGPVYWIGEKSDYVSIHGHIPDVCDNGIRERFSHYLSLKGNFKFITGVVGC